jgi:beta-lactam-binding protein with PASTA domain
VTLTATAAVGSSFAGWSGGGCSGTGGCTVKLDADTSVTATFAPAAQTTPRCIVPNVKGKRLKPAKKAIKLAHCSVGKVTKAFSATVKRGHVIAQKPRAGKKLAPGAKVRLRVSKGKKS